MNDLRSIIKNYGILEAYLEQVAEFTAETIGSYSKILDQPFFGEEYQDRWNELKGIDPIA